MSGHQDPIDPARSRLMSRIKAKNTKPEMLIRSRLHRLGFRFRLHDRRLPGRPDIVLPKYNAVIFINGCFWHRHDCHYFRLPKTRTAFWAEKLFANQERDERKRTALVKAGWRVATVWECGVRDRSEEELVCLVNDISKWIREPSESGQSVPAPVEIHFPP